MKIASYEELASSLRRSIGRDGAPPPPVADAMGEVIAITRALSSEHDVVRLPHIYAHLHNV